MQNLPALICEGAHRLSVSPFVLQADVRDASGQSAQEAGKLRAAFRVLSERAALTLARPTPARSSSSGDAQPKGGRSFRQRAAPAARYEPAT